MKRFKNIITVLICFSISFLSCTKSNQNKQVLTSDEKQDSILASEIISEKYTIPALNRYNRFIDKLDSTKAESSKIAVDTFKTLFKNQSGSICDTAFVIFDKKYDCLGRNLNLAHANDTTDFDAYVFNDQQPVSKKFLEYKEKLNKNGFKISTEEDMTYIEEDWNFILKSFISSVSPTMKDYIVEQTKENNEGFMNDASFTISPIQLIDRIIWYEKFNYENPQFIFIENCKAKRLNYFSFLLTGIDNTPLYEDNENDSMSAFYRSALDYLRNKYPGSETAKLAIPYFTAIEQNKIETADDILKNYRKEGFVIDFED